MPIGAALEQRSETQPSSADWLGSLSRSRSTEGAVGCRQTGDEHPTATATATATYIIPSHPIILNVDIDPGRRRRCVRCFSICYIIPVVLLPHRTLATAPQRLLIYRPSSLPLALTIIAPADQSLASHHHSCYGLALTATLPDLSCLPCHRCLPTCPLSSLFDHYSYYQPNSTHSPPPVNDSVDTLFFVCPPQRMRNNALLPSSAVTF